MRITNNMMIGNMMRNLNNNMRRMDKVNQKMSSGKKFQLPSDDPIGVSKSLKLNTDLSKVEQYKRNVDDAVSWLEVTEDAMASIGDVLQRARELTVQASNGTTSTEDKQKISAEIEQLRDHMVKLSNTSYAGRYVFSGYKTDAPLLDENGYYKLTSFKDGTVIAGDIKNLGANEVSTYNVGMSETISVNTVGMQLFGVYDSANLENGNFSQTSVNGYIVDDGAGIAQADATTDKSYLIGIFDDLKNAMDTGDTDTINKTLGRIDNINENLLGLRAEIGAKSNRLELTQNRLESQTLNFTKLLSDNEDADMAEVYIDLKIEENIYQSALSAGAKIIQPTLIDFIR